MKEELTELPKGWEWTKLGEIGEIAAGGTPSTKDESNFNGKVPWLTPIDLSGYNRKYISKGRRNISQKGLSSSSAILLPKGTVLYSSRAPIGYVAIADNSISTNQGFKNLIIGENIFNEYVYHYLKGNKVLAESYASGTTFKELSAKRFSIIPIPLPPLPEQHRIVTKIEELFTSLDAGIDELRKTQGQLKRYHQSVLKAAVEGKLTAEWREEHKGELEPASVLLERIKVERKRKLGKKYKELPPVDTSELSELPDGWMWEKLGNVCSTTSGGTPSRKKKEYYNGKIPWLKSGELKDNLITSTEETITELGLSNSSAKTFPKGTLLIALYGATVGKTGLLEIKSTTNQAICGISDYQDVFETSYLWNFLISFRNELIRKSFGGAQPNISQGIIRTLVVPVAPLPEQRKIIEEIERRLSVADKIEEVVEENLKRAERLRQSILKRTFEGKLVPQDPSDEPASVLLERIKAEKAKREADTKARKRKRKVHKAVQRRSG